MKGSFYILYKFIPLEAFEKTLETWALKASLRDDVNDPLENIPAFDSDTHARAFSEDMISWDIPPFFSFTRCMSIPAMWGHYAGNAKGVCMVFLFPIVPHAIAFESELTSEAHGKLDSSALYGSGLDDIIEDTAFLPMKYDMTRISAQTIYEDTSEGRRLNNRHDLMCTKASCWSYEHEVRILCDIKHADHLKGNMLLYSWPMRFFAGAIRGPKCDLPVSLLEKKIHYYYLIHKAQHPNYLFEKNLLNQFIVVPSSFSATQFTITAPPFQDGMTDTEFWENYHQGRFKRRA